MGILDRFRRRPKSSPDTADSAAPSPPAAPTVDDIYLSVRPPVFRAPFGGSPKPLDPYAQWIKDATLAGDDAPPEAWQFAAESILLQLWLVHDDPQAGPLPVTDDLLSTFGLDTSQAVERARANSAAILDQGWITVADGGPADSFTVAGYPLDRRAALLTVPEVFEPWRDRVPGELLILPGSQHDIMIVGSEAEYLTEAVRSATGSFQQAGDTRLAAVPFAVVDGALRPWRPAAEADRSAPAIREAEVAQRITGYATFTAAFADHLASRGDGVAAVAEHGASASTGAAFSYSTASVIGPTTKIPFVDFVGFENVSPDQDGFVWVRFDRFVGLEPELRSIIMAASWMYGMPVIDFAPPEDLELRSRLSTAIAEAAEDPWL